MSFLKFIGETFLQAMEERAAYEIENFINPPRRKPGRPRKAPKAVSPTPQPKRIATAIPVSPGVDYIPPQRKRESHGDR